MRAACPNDREIRARGQCRQFDTSQKRGGRLGMTRAVEAPSECLSELVLADEAVERLAVDAGVLCRGGDVAVVATQQVAQVRGLEHLHPALLGLFEGQLRAAGEV